MGEITDSTGCAAPTRLPLRVWSMSGVERLTHADGSTAILKYARGPFTREDRILRSAALAGVPVPRVLGSAQGGGLLVMVLEDLGDPLREADDGEAATAAAVLHAAVPPPWLPTLDQSALAALPGNALDHLQRLQAVGRWTEGTDDLTGYLRALDGAADERAADAHAAPFGWVHSEYHSSSLHIGPLGPRLLDFAHSFVGPGLLDLAAWQGLAKAQPPDPARLRALIGAYIAAGGHPDALARRGGLSPERWALGWHRVWAVEWFLEQARTWINDPAKDPGSVKVVRRHLAAAVDLLAA
ncbi:aminoglycoside phosphotransferase family protein [Streptomyces sp. BE20]|nr:aminoglycoside phosphotransferase family protein [Streptomyces sp. BE20]MEE1823786.1 aminoglycoside phosphotransferase family protein [Streptomyces sp. BE20]